MPNGGRATTTPVMEVESFKEGDRVKARHLACARRRRKDWYKTNIKVRSNGTLTSCTTMRTR